MARGSGAPVGASAGDLARLVSTEQALERRMGAARTEAAALVADARARVAQVEAALEADLAAARARFATEVTEECGRRSAELMAQARSQAARYDEVDARGVDRLADLVLRRVAGDSE